MRPADPWQRNHREIDRSLTARVAMARARVFPEGLATRNRAGVPVQAVGLLTIFSVAAVVLGGTVRQYAMMAVMSVMILQVLQGLALLRLPKVMPAEWAVAGFKLQGASRTVVVTLLVVVSAGFWWSHHLRP